MLVILLALSKHTGFQLSTLKAQMVSGIWSSVGLTLTSNLHNRRCRSYWILFRRTVPPIYHRRMESPQCATQSTPPPRQLVQRRYSYIGGPIWHRHQSSTWPPNVSRGCWSRPDVSRVGRYCDLDRNLRLDHWIQREHFSIQLPVWLYGLFRSHGASVRFPVSRQL